MNKELRVLVVEDSEEDTFMLLRELERGGFAPVHERVQTAGAMTAALDKHPWDLVISDHSMPGFDSLAALKLARARQPEVPFIVMSGTIGEDTAVGLMKAGANDYVMKDRPSRLAAAIQNELREAEVRKARRLAEETLKHNEQDLEDFFNHAPVGLRWESTDGTILRVNDAELKMLGYAREEYLGHNIAEFHAEKNVAADILRRLNRGETLDNYEARLRCQNGDVKDVIINSNALRVNGQFVHSRSFTRDITAQKQAQTARAYLAAIVESSEDAVIGKNLDGEILTWNSAAERMYGYQAEEVKGRSIALLVPPHRPEELPEMYEKRRRGEPIERYETIRVRKDGRHLDVSLTVSPIMVGGKIVGVSAIERDITALKREEAERLQLIMELTEALARIKTLKGLLPICASCKKIRDDKGYWQKVELYISKHTEAEFTHGICPDCAQRLYPEYKKE
jgi:PAS domain S-box-containing protein